MVVLHGCLVDAEEDRAHDLVGTKAAGEGVVLDGVEELLWLRAEEGEAELCAEELVEAGPDEALVSGVAAWVGDYGVDLVSEVVAVDKGARVFDRSYVQDDDDPVWNEFRGCLSVMLTKFARARCPQSPALKKVHLPMPASIHRPNRIRIRFQLIKKMRIRLRQHIPRMIKPIIRHISSHDGINPRPRRIRVRCASINVIHISPRLGAHIAEMEFHTGIQSPAAHADRFATL